MREKFKSKSIRNRIVLIYIKLILPLNILYFVSVVASVVIIENQAKISLLNLSNFYIQQLDNRIASVNYYFYNLEETNVPLLTISQQNNDSQYQLAKSRVANEFSTYISSTSNVEGLFYYSPSINDAAVIIPKLDEIATSTELSSIRLNLIQWIKQGDMDGISNWSVIHLQGHNWLIRVYKKDGFYYGALFSLDQIQLQMHKVAKWSGLKVDFQETDPIRDEINAVSKSSKINFTISCSLKKTEVIRSLPILQILGFFCAVLYLILIPVLVIILNRELIRPLNRIKLALLKMKQGESDYRISSHDYAEEFVSINQSFNEMADSIKYLKIENYEKEIEKKKVEFQNLQLQVNPHFLLNSFNLIFNLASVKDFTGVQKMIQYLTEYFRYVFRDNKEKQPLFREIDLIRRYLEMSALRYPDYFDTEYEIASEIMDFEIPPLLLHNFVENIVKHVIHFGRKIHIVIRGYESEGYVVFEIEDDGDGIAEEICDRINQGIFSEEESENKKIGFYNSYQRIKNYFGEESYMCTKNRNGHGLCVTVGLKKGVEDESTDRG